MAQEEHRGCREGRAALGGSGVLRGRVGSELSLQGWEGWRVCPVGGAAEISPSQGTHTAAGGTCGTCSGPKRSADAPTAVFLLGEARGRGLLPH